jgi:hypothetical protein
MSMPKHESLKQQAKLIRKFMSDKYQLDVPHGHCMELMSQLFGFKDWNTASATLKSKAKPDILPMPVKTVGDMRKALALFPDDAAMLDGEYEFNLKDFMSEIVDLDDLDGVITQEFSLVLEHVERDIASFKLKLEHEDIQYSAG